MSGASLQSDKPLARGFVDPPRCSQQAFRALMDAMARPGIPRALDARLAPPAPLTPELAALALTVLDYETAVWLDPPLTAEPAVADFLRFHTSARLVEQPGDAQFALQYVNGLPTALELFNGGGVVTDELRVGTTWDAVLPAGGACAADLDGDGTVGGADLGILLGQWGTPGVDLDGDGTTNGADLGLLLGAWGAIGACP